MSIYHNVLKTLSRKLNHAHVVTDIIHNIKPNQQYLTVYYYKYSGTSTLSYNMVIIPISRGKNGLFYAKGDAGLNCKPERISFVELRFKRYGYFTKDNLVSDLLDSGVKL